MLIAASLSKIFYKDHFLASNELGNRPQILIKFLTISQKQNQKTAPKNQTTKKPPHQPIGVNNCTIKLECKLRYVQTGIHITEIILREWDIPVETFLLLYPNFIKEKLICNFLLYRYEKETRRQSWEKQMLPKGQRWHLVVLVFVPATPTPWERSVPAGLHGFPCSQDSNNGPHSSSSKCLFMPLQ